MEKKQSSQKAKTFFKKNVYYIIMAVCLLAIAAMITVSVLINNGTIGGVDPDTPANTGDPTTNPTDNPTDNPADNPADDPSTNPTIDPNDSPTDNPVIDPPAAIVFAKPVESVNVLLDYSMDQLVFNSTLKHYAVHNGIDFGGADGTNVFCVYDGVVSDVSYDILNGYTVTIKHNDTLSTIYSSLNEPVVSQGQTVKKGGIIGTMGSTATKEYAMGSHVHFCVTENGKFVDPDGYLTVTENK